MAGARLQFDLGGKLNRAFGQSIANTKINCFHQIILVATQRAPAHSTTNCVNMYHTAQRNPTPNPEART